MNFLGLSITKALPEGLASPPRRGWNRVLESFAGAWQKNIEVSFDDVMTNPFVYSCITLIASDVAKLPIRLVKRDNDTGIWTPAYSAAFTPVLEKPNHFQTRIEFVQQWIVSKLAFGNAYVLKIRDNRGVVVAMYLLDPRGVKPLVSAGGAVFYQCSSDRLASIEKMTGVTFPASEIIHDKYCPLYHPLVGISPIYANGTVATTSLAIQKNSARFFQNASMPAGVLTAPALISDETAARLKLTWDDGYGGDNVGKTAVLGDGLRWEPIAFKAIDSQMREQYKDTAETICSTFHVPPYKIGVGSMPTYSNGELLNLTYYTDCLQILIETLELLLDEGLGLTTTKDGVRYGVDLDVNYSLRMDFKTKAEVHAKLIGASLESPNEGRRAFDLLPVKGGETPMIQQQNFPLAALSDFHAQALAGKKPEPEDPEEPKENAEEKFMRELVEGIKCL